MPQSRPPHFPLALVVLLFGSSLSAEDTRYRARLKPPPTQAAILQHVAPGRDAFPEEATAEALSRVLGDLSRALVSGRAADSLPKLLAPDFRGGRLTPVEEVAVAAGGALEVHRAKSLSNELPRDRNTFAPEIDALVGEMAPLRLAELLITRIEEKPDPAGALATTEVRYDIAGAGEGAWRSERVGRWRMKWRKAPAGTWQLVEWAALADERSRATAPVFVDATAGALARNPSFERQLGHGLDDWLATMDSVFQRDSMGHHGVSVGDADGDGLDDIYVSQPAGFPNRLFRNVGDGTFADITEAAGLAVLDDTSQTLFADVDNDGDQDVVLVTGSGLMLFTNDGKARFTRVPEPFQIKGGLKGSPMALAVADYDRDGFLDVYLCTYSYSIGVTEDKGGTPSPYHDAQNGPPNVLLRNDGRGRFVDVTDEVGMDENNNRYSFAAAWGDYDGDGWPDLAVANDFGRKNLYHNEGLKDGQVRFRDVAKDAGVEDFGAGMSAAWVDYDNDGRLDLYFGNMWSAAGQRITAEPGFLPSAPADTRELFRRHARGNSLFRNKGDGTFEDVTLATRTEMGRWAWSSDALDFDGDGFEDLYVVDGMFTRHGEEEDLDGFFWRQIVARSPLSHATGTPYDDAWRAINRLLADKSQANHQRNVFLRNDGHGVFDEVSAAVGLDLDQDGRSFAAFDYDQDGDPDLVLMAARSAPQLRVFRNELAHTNASLAIRLLGAGKNRDAIGARVTVETDKLRRTKAVTTSSGFISQHSKELLFGLGPSERILQVTIDWPSGVSQVLQDVPINHRLRVSEGGAFTAEVYRAAGPVVAAATPSAAPPVPKANWFFEAFPAPDFTLPDLQGKERSLAALRGRPALLLFFAPSVPASRAVLQEISRQKAALDTAGVGVLAVALDGLRTSAQGLGGVPVVLGNEAVGNAYTLVHHYVFVGKGDLPLPSAFLLNAQGEIVRAYRGEIQAAAIAADAAKIDAAEPERLARAVPFPGTFYWKPGDRNYLQYGLELVEQGLDPLALPAFERAAKGDPSAFTLYSLGTLYTRGGQTDRARAAFESALKAKPDFAEASNGLGALMAQGGNVPAAIELFKKALEATPDYPDAMNNLGYALLQTGHAQEAYDLYQSALKLQPEFPEAFNNLGIYYARQGEMAKAESYFRQAVDKRPEYGEAANNFALVLMTHDAADEATSVLRRALEANPDFEMTYVTLAKIYASTEKRREALQTLERLLQKNPQNQIALQMARDLRAAQ